MRGPTDAHNWLVADPPAALRHLRSLVLAHRGAVPPVALALKVSCSTAHRLLVASGLDAEARELRARRPR